MKKMRLICLMIIMCLITLIATSCGQTNKAPDKAQDAKETRQIEYLASAPTVATYVIAYSLGEIATKEHPWLRIRATETPGFIYNLKELGSKPELWKNTVAEITQGQIYLAEKGISPHEERVNDMKIIGITRSCGNFLVTLNPNIKTVEDLVGKRIALGTKSQINSGWEIYTILDKGYGIADKIKIDFIGLDEAKDALINGLVDAVPGQYLYNPVTKEMVPAPSFAELLASGRELYYIDLGKEAIEKVKKEIGYPFYTYIVPAGTFKFQTKDIAFQGSNVTPAVKSEFDEELAYELTKLYLDHYKELEGYHQLGKLIRPESLTYGLTKRDLHPGAVRAYEERGITIPE